MDFKAIYHADLQRNHKGHARRFIRCLRKCQCCHGIVKLYYRAVLHRMMLKYGLEIPWNCTIGKGLYLGHAFNITVNPLATIGKWCNIHKGVTIGQQNRGRLKGAPTIGDYVWIGANATIVGKITIGNDVLIAPGTYVNCDIPSHSIVLGNPCIIHHKENATEGYINHTN